MDEINVRRLSITDFTEQDLEFCEESHWRKDLDLREGFMLLVDSPCGEWYLRLQLTGENESALRDWLNARELCRRESEVGDV